jgi:hypothetical protein
MLGRMAIFLTILVLCFLPSLFVDYDDGYKARTFLQVFVPCTVFSILLFGFCDQLFFKMKLYDLDEHNMEKHNTTFDEDPFASYKSDSRIN